MLLELTLHDVLAPAHALEGSGGAGYRTPRYRSPATVHSATVHGRFRSHRTRTGSHVARTNYTLKAVCCLLHLTHLPECDKILRHYGPRLKKRLDRGPSRDVELTSVVNYVLT